MQKITNNYMKVTCFLNNKKLCEFNWDDMPKTGMSFDCENMEYMITKIDNSKITVKDITKVNKKK